MSEETTKQVTPPEKRNPEGKGGFGEHPENRSDGRWLKENSYSYWMNFFKTMNTEDFENYEKNKAGKMTMAESAAYERVKRSRPNLREFEVVANRTEGMPKQQIETTGELNVNLSRDLTKEEKELLDKIIEKKVSEI